MLTNDEQMTKVGQLTNAGKLSIIVGQMTNVEQLTEVGK